jgi:hypothetical protein
VICNHCGAQFASDDSLICEPCLEIELGPRAPHEMRERPVAKSGTDVGIFFSKPPEQKK